MNVTIIGNKMEKASIDRAHAAADAFVSKASAAASRVLSGMGKVYDAGVDELHGLTPPETIRAISFIKAGMKEGSVPVGTLNLIFTVMTFYAKRGERLPDTFKDARIGYTEAKLLEKEVRAARQPTAAEEDSEEAGNASEAVAVRVAPTSDARRVALALNQLSPADVARVAAFAENLVSEANMDAAAARLERHIAADAAESLDMEAEAA